MLYIFYDSSYVLADRILKENKNPKVILYDTKELSFYKNIFCRILSKILYLFGKANKYNFSKKMTFLLKEIKPTDSILLWDISSPTLILSLCNLTKCMSINVWLWNQISYYNFKEEEIQFLKKYVQFYTFDKNDSVNFGISYKNQVTYNISAYHYGKCEKNSDIYFIGNDKGRYKLVKEIFDYCNNNSLNPDFTVIKDNSSELEDSPLYGKTISFEDNISHIASTKCVLEIVMDKQTGSTLRALEALIAGKKLITNNAAIKDEDFYDKNRILVLNGTNLNKIKDFLNIPIKTSLTEFKKYLMSEWIVDFIR